MFWNLSAWSRFLRSLRRPAKHARRRVPLEVEPLETRWLMSVSGSPTSVQARG